jgi:hypothetical protein
LLIQVVDATHAKAPSDDGANFMLAAIKGIEPRDQIEAMLAAQMAAVHSATMIFAKRFGNVENVPRRDSAERASTNSLGLSPRKCQP